MSEYLYRSRPAGTAVLATAEQVGASSSTVVGATDMPFASGMFSRFNEWAEVNNSREGRFFERFERGAFLRSIREDRAALRILYDHGADGFISRRPIAPLDGIGEDERGAWYFGRLFDTIAAREIAPLLAGGVLGSSFRFAITRVRYDDRPVRADRNPDRLPERTILEARLAEIGPTPFPVYAGSTAGTMTGMHPPRSQPAMPGRSRMTDAEWRAFLDRLPSRKAGDPVATRRWLDKVMPLPRGRT